MSKVTILKARRGFSRLALPEIWQYRDLLYFLAWRDIKVRYKQTFFGAAWAIIQPVMTMIIFTIFFGRLAHIPSEGYPYPLFVFAALLPWTFFSNVIRVSTTSIIEDANLISKIYFPRIIMPAAVVGVELIDLGISCLLFFALMAWYGLGVTQMLFVLPFLLLVLTLAAVGVGMILSALSVMYRDFRYVAPFLIQLWLYASPVVYPANLVPEKWRPLAALNPMVGIIDGFRGAFLGKPIDITLLAISTAVAVLFFVTGFLYFQRVERTFADII